MIINFKTIKWIVGLGYVLVIYSASTYLVNYLPVDFWVTVSNLFTSENKHVYYKLVATEGYENYALLSLLVGIALIVAGKLYARKENT